MFRFSLEYHSSTDECHSILVIYQTLKKDDMTIFCSEIKNEAKERVVQPYYVGYSKSFDQGHFNHLIGKLSAEFSI